MKHIIIFCLLVSLAGCATVKDVKKVRYSSFMPPLPAFTMMTIKVCLCIRLLTHSYKIIILFIIKYTAL